MSFLAYLQYLTWIENILLYFLPVVVLAVLYSKAVFKQNPQQYHNVVSGKLIQLDKKLLFLIFLLIFGALDRMVSYAEAYETDQMVYSLIASKMLDGEMLYADVWDHKPPATYWVYMLFIWLFGLNPLAIWMIGYVFFAITLLGCYVLASQLGGKLAGVLAATFWTLFNTDIFFQGNQPNTEVFMNAALIWAMVYTVRMVDSDQLRYPVVAGLLFFLATLFKMVAITVPVVLALYLVFANLNNSKQLRQKIIQLIWLAAVAAALWGCVFTYYALLGIFDDFWNAVFVYNSFYAGNLWTNIISVFSIKEFVFIIPYLLMLATVLLAAALGGRYLFLIFLYITGALIATALPGKLYFHYYQLLLPGLSVGVGILLVMALEKRSWVFAMVLGLTVLIPLSGKVMQIMLPAHLYPTFKYGTNEGLGFIEAKLMAGWLKENVGKEKVIYHWGVSPGVYFWSGYSFPTSVILASHFIGDNPVVRNNVEVTLKQLESNKPDLIIASQEWLNPELSPVSKWIINNYKFIEGPEYIHVTRFMIPRQP